MGGLELGLAILGGIWLTAFLLGLAWIIYGTLWQRHRMLRRLKRHGFIVLRRGNDGLWRY